MKNGVCPKCGLDNVHTDALFLPRRGDGLFTITPFDRTRVCNYVCTDCGYMESYIIDEKALRRLAQYVPRVDTRKRKSR